MDLLDRLARIRSKPERLALGLMSGMSVDGLDLALVRIRDGADRPAVELLAAGTVPYDAALVAAIRTAADGTTRDVCALSFALAERWAADVWAFLEEHGVDAEDVDVLGSHGQTVDHVSAGGPGAQGSTLQVGDGDVLAERTGILTVSDLRCRDIAAGGEGAPLVPLADWLLFGRDGETVAAQNLGSIGNVTVVTPRLEDVSAFDTGPANALVDGLARLAAGMALDLDGSLSARGQVHAPALKGLHQLSARFLEREPPKSAGFDDFGPPLARRIHESFPDARPEDLIRTAVEFTASTLADAYERWVVPAHPALRRVIVTGGGAANPTMMAAISERLEPLGLVVEVPEDAWTSAKEAIAFALLADRTVRGLPGNVPGATGASRAVVLGKISL